MDSQLSLVCQDVNLRRSPMKVSLKDIQRLQGQLSTLPQLDVPPVHRFADGVYSRELLMPKGSLWVSKIHKKQHFAVMVYGDTTVYTEREGKQRLTGYHLMRTEPGTKRALYMHEDTLWVTFHPTQNTDLVEIEREIIEPDDMDVINAFALEFQRAIGESP